MDDVGGAELQDRVQYPDMSQRVTQAILQVLSPLAVPNVRATAVHAIVLGFNPAPKRRVTQLHVEVLAYHPPVPPRITQCWANILATRSPSYEFIPMVLEDVFPYDISYDSVGSTRFATDVIVVDSGDDQRVGRWDSPLMEYDVAYGVRTMEQLLKLIQFFRAMRGRLYAFCYQDNIDFTSSIPTAYEARAAPAISMMDQFIATGDGLTYAFQLIKTYNSATQSQIRTITCPQPGTLLVAINGNRVTNWSVGNTTGIVTFYSPYTQTFEGVPITHESGLANATLTAAAGTFEAFRLYVGLNCYTSGWTSPNNNTTLAQDVSIEYVSTDGSAMTLGYPNGYGTGGETTEGVTITVHPAPLAGQTITAGYLFFVPCRFDTDILPVTIQDYGVGGSNSVKLIEVRASDPD